MVALSGDEIRQRREALGMSQAELAGWAGVHVRTVSKWERGVHKPPQMLAVALGLLKKRPDMFDKHRFRRPRRAATAAEGGDGG